ncbi:protein ROOT PRIMORDIUM DEFECTIVE 1 [Carex littledalei]|uniref:Protein ROOT PRIMORDIUM DEFECTIVE 1 n=1 Tax=Carex littledalei TaxID=544730 RepID=A0A833RHN5_9POAL|nr:protein ROOT PRIMORDIUM DEFECTIVE 1 [Carex littledalei]
MVRRLFSATSTPNPNHNPSLPVSRSSAALAAAKSILPFLSCKRRKKLRKKLSSPRVAPIQREPSLRDLPSLDAILDRDAAFRFLHRTKSYLSSLPSPVLPLSTAGTRYRELGFPRGRNVSKYALRHPLLFHLPPIGKVPHLSFTPLMKSLLAEEKTLFDLLEAERMTTIRKLLMIFVNHRVPLAKLHHCRALFGLPDDFRDRVREYPKFFRVVVDPDGRHVLELESWDKNLAVSALEREFMSDEAQAQKLFRFHIPHRKELPIDDVERRELDKIITFPMISPYSDGSGFKPWTVEAEKYRVGLIHEFLSLTLEKRAWIHDIVEFKEELCLTRRTYEMLRKQPRAFYLAGTEMNWAVFLKHAYQDDGTLIDKDPLVAFNEKLHKYACMTELDKQIIDGSF